MSTFKQGDKVVIRLEGTYVRPLAIGVGHVVYVNKRDGVKSHIQVSTDKIVEHEPAEPQTPQTVVKVDGRIFVRGGAAHIDKPHWYSLTYTYTWEELLTLGKPEIIHEPESEV